MSAHTADHLHAQLARAGFHLSLAPSGGIAVTPASKLTPALRATIRSNKAALVAWLRENDDLPQPLPREVLVEEYRLFTKLQPLPEPPSDPQAWRELAQAYHQHHFKCHQCQAAGRSARYGMRCGVGAALWANYSTSI